MSKNHIFRSQNQMDSTYTEKKKWTIW